MAMTRIGKVRGLQGPPGPGYNNALQLESDVAALQAQLPDIAAKANAAIPQNQKGATNGVASLDEGGKVPASQLPSYVDDVLEFANFAAFPPEGESGKVYVAKNTNKTYRWSGSGYVLIGGDLALGETANTAYSGEKGKSNADNIALLQEALTSLNATVSTFEGQTAQDFATTNGEVEIVRNLAQLAKDIAEDAIPTDQMGVNNGVATLNEGGKIPSSQLPSFVDDVLEFNSFVQFPPEGESGKVYVAKNTNKTYRWSGSGYVLIGGDLSLGETSSTAYPGNLGKTNADAITQINGILESLASSFASGFSTIENGKIDKAEKGALNGVASLDATGKVFSSQLPSYVDDVLEYERIDNFPLIGEASKIYVDKQTNKTYRWSGSGYVEIAPSVTLGETENNAYPGNKGKANADHINSLLESLQTINSQIGSINTDINSLNNTKIDKTSRGAAGGVAELDEEGKIPAARIPVSQLGTSIGCFGFEVNGDGDLLMYYPDELDPAPQAWVNEDGDLLINLTPSLSI
jgi:hypothetical protein